MSYDRNYASIEDSPWYTHWSIILTAIVVVCGVGYYTYDTRAKERARIEQERIAADKAAQLAAIAAKQEAQQKVLNIVETALDTQASQNQQIIDARERHYNDAKERYDREQAKADERRALSDAAAREYQAQREKLAEQARARQELDRQAQYLRDAEWERQRAAERQAASAARDQARQDALDARNRARR